ncbi:MAG: hypothetical protein HXK08_04685 [Actinomyces sp.]|nr:hypothetical protein [Actinomyces sp.]
MSHVFARLRALPDGARGHEALRRGLGGTAVLGSSGFTTVARPLGTDAAVARYLHDEVEPRAARGDDERAGGQPPMEPVRQTVLWGQLAQLFIPPTPGE